MELTNFSFNTDVIQVFDEQGQYVSVKNLCKNIGIDFKTQYEKILGDESFCSKSFKIETNGGVQVALCIPVEKINGWLFSINPNKVKPEIKAKLLIYKNECFKVLFDHFNANKFSHYVNRIADLNAVLIDNAKRHKREINGYKSQLKQHNDKIVVLKHELEKASNLRPSDPIYAQIKAERDYYKERYKKLSQSKDETIILNLAKIQKELEKSYTAIGAVMAYADGDDYFVKNNK